MKKRLLWALCALLLMLPALASAEAISITELREQVEEMGRWTQTYEAYGRTIEVDIPIIVPEVDRVPILTVKAIDAINSEKIEKDPLLHEAGMDGLMRRIEDEGLFPYLYSGQSDDSPTEVYIVDGRKTLLIRHHSPLILRGIKPKDFLKYDRTCYYPFELDAKNTYAEENEMSLEEATACIKDILDYYYPGRDNRFSVNYAEVIGRARKTKDASDLVLGETVEYYPCGTFNIHYSQNMYGIPVYVQVNELYDSQKQAANQVYGDGFKELGRIDYYAEIMSRDLSVEMYALMFEVNEVAQEDVPLAPVSQVIFSIEDEIEKGHIRNVYALRLGYVCYLNPSSSESYSLYPMWVLECDYVGSANEEIRKYIYSDEYRDGFNFARVGVNAQTGEIVDRMKPNKECLYCPEIITWEGAR